MARRRRRTASPFALLILLVCVGSIYWGFFRTGQTTPADVGEAPPRLVSDRPADDEDAAGPFVDVPEKGTSPDATPSTSTSAGDCTARVALARTARQSGDLVTARAQLGEAFAKCDLAADVRAQVQAELVQLGDATIFGSNIVDNDPFADSHVIQSGETLGIIAKRFAVTASFLAKINQIPDPNRVRAGQRIKVVRGPFHVTVNRKDFEMRVMLGETFVRRYPVGLGADQGTPGGVWRVRDKLENPTYYPPRGGKILAADDPENPLGERWIGLEGVEGDAVGQQRYGIHGTIEPDSIGKSVSLGCIRMYNEDVEELFDLLIVEQSRIVVE